ncbi:acyl-CoA synthetase/AMP-acid ligaseII [Striga asiatica]|uniref:Acyl-CoA synthetase/AMP-acid ligaseII n=1 Tax=Striga asiatica TaxID=4170 RepID=A0A5A7PR50_STRAF|nr:acyl-CoA synthetase/AMP-acid ligaseII [Striga asiatica]
MDPSLTSLGTSTLSLKEHTTEFSSCNKAPTRFARAVNGNIRGHLCSPYDLNASSTLKVPVFTASASNPVRTIASSSAQQAPCPRFGVIGCQASPTRTTFPFEDGGLTPGQSHRSTRGVLIIVSSGEDRMTSKSSVGQSLTSVSVSCLKMDGSHMPGDGLLKQTNQYTFVWETGTWRYTDKAKTLDDIWDSSSSLRMVSPFSLVSMFFKLEENEIAFGGSWEASVSNRILLSTARTS